MTTWRKASIEMVLGVIAVTIGCGGMEPAVDDEEACAVSGAEAVPGSVLRPGALKGDRFTPFAEGDPLEIIDAPQGGTWVMPAARFTGVSAEGTLSADVSLDGVQVVGELREARVRLEEVPGGALQVAYIPIPIGGDARGISAEGVSGRAARLRVEFLDACERLVEEEVGVTLRYHAGEP